MPYFKKAIEDDKWRVRLEAYESLVCIAKHFANQDLFTKHIETLFMQYMKERVAQVRETGQEKLAILIHTFKVEWVFQKLLPKIQENLDKNLGYLFRMTALGSLKTIALNTPPDIAHEKILPMIYK